jgi:hypothetical protein
MFPGVDTLIAVTQRWLKGGKKLQLILILNK